MTGTPTETELEDFQAFSLELMAAAGQEALRFFRIPIEIENKRGRGALDPVTEGDRQAEATMRRLINARFPEHGIIGEEFGAENADAPYCWTLDPIDGTRAFVSGLPTWGILAGLSHEGVPVVGAMGQPYTDEVFVGSRLGSSLHRKGATTRLRTRACPALKDAVLSTTSPGLFSAEERPCYDTLEGYAKLTRYGMDCYAYSIVASGFIDIVVESGLAPYDICALIPIIEGAGGQVTGWTGQSAAQGGRILATGDSALHEAALEVLSLSD